MVNIKSIKTKQYIKFVIALVSYLLMVYWIGNYWLLLGLPIIFDVYISKKVNWAFYKKKDIKDKRKKNAVEWIDAFIFALVASTLIKIFFFQLYAIPTSSLEKTLLVGDRLIVSKVSFGPQIPNTPLSFPLVHNTLPLTNSVNSYLEWISWPYKRLAGLSKIKNDDIVVFNFPVGDTILVGHENPDYYAWVREGGRSNILKNYKIKVRPIDKRENYVKRCVCIPGDTLKIIDGQAYVNGKKQRKVEGIQYNYIFETDNVPINPKTLMNFGIAKDDIRFSADSRYKLILPLTDEMVQKIKKFPKVKLTKMLNPKGIYDSRIFPHNEKYRWNEDNFGPLYIPKKGTTISINLDNLPLYQRVIAVYENNDMQIKDGKIFINGKETDKYTFKMDYYWMMGDNRHNSADARAWGFVPEDHIVGKPVLVFYSLDKDKSFIKSIRWDRIFKLVHND